MVKTLIQTTEYYKPTQNNEPLPLYLTFITKQINRAKETSHKNK